MNTDIPASLAGPLPIRPAPGRPGLARPDRLIMAVVFACSIVAGWAMLPGENERVAMLERDGHTREALAILEQQVTAGDKRYRTLHQVLALYESEGNIAKARSVLEIMSAERPRDAALKRRLAQFYRNNQNDPEYVKAMQDLIEIRYSESACRELIARLRYMGDSKAEQAVLQNCRQKGYRRADDLSRLAELVAADGDSAQATALLKSIDDLKRLKELRERFQLLSLLSEQDQPREAERRALRWIRAVHDDETAVSIIDHLARTKYPESAYEVAKDAGVPGDGISLTVAERLVEKTQNGAALLYLRGWIEKAKTVDAETAIRFVDAALGVGDPRLAVKGARQFGYVLLPPLTLKKLSEALDKGDAPVEAAEVRRAMTQSLPVVAVVQGLASGATDTSGSFEAPEAAGKSAGTSESSIRSVLLVDPLDSWRRSLFSTMSTDAQRRMQALFVGPKPTPLHASRHFDGHGRVRLEPRSEHRGDSARLLNKTSRVLQRTKRLSALKAKRKAIGQPKTKLPASDVQPGVKSKSNGAQKP
jgi:thioredoxin-like negative regulator of GroEL